MNYSKYSMTYRMARGTDLTTRFGKALYWFTMISYSVCVLAIVSASIVFFGYAAICLIARHFGWDF